MIKRLDTGEQIPYIRVGTDFFKVIHKPDRFGIEREELKKWNQQTLLIDHNKTYLGKIPSYDDFIIIPDNINPEPIINNCYNMYAKFPHKPKKANTNGRPKCLTMYLAIKSKPG